jgi:hypothetical protein
MQIYLIADFFVFFMVIKLPCITDVEVYSFKYPPNDHWLKAWLPAYNAIGKK